jgi:hypothetical protein
MEVPMRQALSSLFLTGALCVVALPAPAQEPTAEDVVPGIPFKEGEVLSFEHLDKLKDYLPPAFWKNREYFFYEGMELEVGPFFADYSEAEAYVEAGEKYGSQAVLGKDGALVGYVAGRPFPEEIDCKGDPQAGLKLIWNFTKRWRGDGSRAQYFYSYWDRGEQLPLYYEGTSKTIQLANRPEAQYREQDGDIFKKEKRNSAFGVEVNAPFDARGIMLMTYRYKAADAPIAQSKNDDTWVYLPDLRRVRRISSAQRTDAVAGTDFTFDDLFSFSGIPPQYEWECLGETCATPGSSDSIPRTPIIPTPTRISGSTSRPTTRSTALRTTGRKSSGRSSGTTTAGARTGTRTTPRRRGATGTRVGRESRSPAICA